MKETTITITFKHDPFDGTGVLTFNSTGEKISDFEMIGILQTLVNESINRHNRFAADLLARKVFRDDARQKAESHEFLQGLKERMDQAEKENAEKEAKAKRDKARKPRKKPATLPKDSSNGKPGDVAK